MKYDGMLYRLSRPQRVVAALVLVTALFRLQHWPYAEWMFIATAIGIPLSAAITFFLANAHPKRKYMGLTFSMVIGFFLLAPYMGIYWGRNWLLWVLLFALLWNALAGHPPLYMMKDTQKSYARVNRKNWLLNLLGTSLILVGALFKIQHWPYASLLLITGLVIAAANYLGIFNSGTDETSEILDHDVFDEEPIE